MSDKIEVPRELFEWLVDYALELRSEWKWKDGTTRRNNRDMDRLTKHIVEGITLRDATNAEVSDGV